MYLEGTVVGGRYRVVRLLGEGGQAQVYEAVSATTGRSVAIKVLQPASDGSPAAVDCQREARAIGSIASDHVVEVLDVLADDPCLVLELLEGETLLERLKRSGPVAFAELHPIVAELWMGLCDVHRAGVVHRSLKPSNVFLQRRPDGVRVKIIGFTLARPPGVAEPVALSRFGQSLGSFSFMPPEQIAKAETVDHRADIYACATLVYQALSGELPYAAGNILALAEMKSQTDARPLAEAVDSPVAPDLERFLGVGLARAHTDRFASAEEALSAWRSLGSSAR